MSKSSTAVKHKYNKSAYRRYEFSVGIDTKLNYILERYLLDPNNSLSALIKNQLALYFGVSPDELFCPYHCGKVNGVWVDIPNNELDLLFESLPS